MRLHLRQLCDKDSLLGYRVMTQLAKEAIERLMAARVQLAAAWSRQLSMLLARM